MAKYEILEEIAQLNRRGNSSLCLDKVQCDGADARYDLRVWHFHPYGERDPGRGIMLREEDLRALYKALQRYYGNTEKADRSEEVLFDTPL